jgi:hypothetical protein
LVATLKQTIRANKKRRVALEKQRREAFARLLLWKKHAKPGDLLENAPPVAEHRRVREQLETLSQSESMIGRMSQQPSAQAWRKP